jgi:peptide deformylase
MPVAPLNGELATRALTAAAAAKVRAREVMDAGRPYGGIRFYGDPVLGTPAVPVPLDRVIDVRALAEELRRVCAERRGGVAIAAQQVGAQWAVILTPVKGVRTIMVNPTVIRKARKTTLGAEGCLSVPDYWTNVERRNWVEVRFTPEDLSEPVTVKLEGFEARAVQHELDHLAGRCIVDGATRQQRRHAERCVAKARAVRFGLGEFDALATGSFR